MPGCVAGLNPKKFMLTENEQAMVLEKTRELCTTILSQPNMGSIRKNIDAFLADDLARADYETLMEKGQALHEKQHRSLPLTGEEISDFEQHRDKVMNNPVARGFMDAQESLQEIQGSIQQHVTKALELGRMPTPEDFEHGCGSGSCGCKH
jgi:cell fate (sporulation/competence/biofilm development) regulator YlbF (YheA/YmcA/DUF963 family)